MNFEDADLSKISELEDNRLKELYKQAKIWLKEGYDRAKAKGTAEELIERLIEVEDEMKRRNIPLQPRHWCEYCKKFWNNDPYCPHGFDEDKLWELYKKTRLGKIKFSPLPDYEKIEFWNKDGNFIGEYYETN